MQRRGLEIRGQMTMPQRSIHHLTMLVRGLVGSELSLILHDLRLQILYVALLGLQEVDDGGLILLNTLLVLHHRLLESVQVAHGALQLRRDIANSRGEVAGDVLDGQPQLGLFCLGSRGRQCTDALDQVGFPHDMSITLSIIGRTTYSN